jgi:hypothetical protein
MTNELGITQEDIKEWTMQAVDERVQKYLNSINAENIINDYAKSNLKNLLQDYRKTDEILKDAVAQEIRRTLKINIGLKENE